MDYTIEKIKQLLSQRHGAQADLAEFLGVSKQTISNWVHGRARSYNDYLAQIAAFFGISVSELMPPGEEQGTQLIELAPDELELLQAFRGADPALRKAALMVLRSADK